MSDAYSSAVAQASSSVVVATPAPEPSSWNVWNASDDGYVSFGSSITAAATYNLTSPADESAPGFFQTQAGVGISAGLGGLVLLVLISLFCWCRVRRRRRRVAVLPEVNAPPRLPPRPTRQTTDQMDLLEDPYWGGNPQMSQSSLSSPISPLDPVHTTRSFQSNTLPYERSRFTQSTNRGSTAITDSEFDAFAVDGSSLARTLTNASTSDAGWRTRGQRRLSDIGSSPPASLNRVMRYASAATPSGTFATTTSDPTTTLRTPSTQANTDPFRNPSPPLPPLPPHARRGYPYPPPTESAPSDYEPSMFGGSENNDGDRVVPPSYVDLYGPDGQRR